MEARVAQALPGDNMTNAVETVAAVVRAIFTVSTIGAAHLAPMAQKRNVLITVLSHCWRQTFLQRLLVKRCYLKRMVVGRGRGALGTARHELHSRVVDSPVSDPAGVTVGAPAEDGVTVVSVFADGTHLLAIVTKETFGAVLVTPRPVPASFAGDATTLRHLARLLALAVAAPAIDRIKREAETEKGKKKNRHYHPQNKQSILATKEPTFFCFVLHVNNSAQKVEHLT